MKKIITLFQRNIGGDWKVRDEITPGAEWVVRGEGEATRKWDGTCCLVEGGKFYKRYTLRPGRDAPDGFRPAADPDPNTGKQPGWLPVGPDDKHHLAAWRASSGVPDGTYELVGPKVQGGVEGFEEHRLLRHGDHPLAGVPRDFEGLKSYLSGGGVEGIVWHHPDGRMVKIKASDFGVSRETANGCAK